MDFESAKAVILRLLQGKGKAKNSELLQAVGGDAALFEQIKEDLIFEDLAEDKKGVGLVYCGPAVAAAPAGAPSPPPPAAATLAWEETEPTVPAPRRVFISYGRADCQDLAFRLESDLAVLGHQVWLDKHKIVAGESWEQQIEKGILESDIFISLLTPHAVRRPDGVCLDEISLARYSNRKIIPTMVLQCRPPLGIYRLDWVDFQEWEHPARYQKAFQRLLESMQRRESVEGVHAHLFASLKPLDFGEEVSRLTRDFTGREWFDADLERWLARADSRVFFLTGDPGTGKSALLASLVHRHPLVGAYHFCVSSLVDSLDPARFVRSVAAQLATQFQDYRAALGAVDLEQLRESDPGVLLRRLIADPLKDEKSTTPVLILVDALDEARLFGERNIARVLRERLHDLPSWVRLVVSSRKEPEILDLFSRYRPQEIESGRPENLDDVARYLAQKLREPALAELLRQSGVDPRLLAEVVSRKGGGNFLYVTQVMAALEAGQIDPRRPEGFPDGLVEIYQSFFERAFPQGQGYGRFRPLLDVITAAREPLSAAQIAAFRGCDAFDVAQDLQKIAVFFPERHGRYQAYHKSITDWLCGLAGQSRTYRVNVHGGHRLIADRLLAAHRTGQSDRFVLAHLPAHLVAAERWEELEQLLTDLTFLEGKVGAGMAFELANDFAEALRTLPRERPRCRILRLLEEAFRADIHFLAGQPAALFQCLWNRGWWYDAAEAARHYDPPEGGWPAGGVPWEQGEPRLATLLESWRAAKAKGPPGPPWLRSLRPPATALGSSQLACLQGHREPVLGVAFSPDGSRLASAAFDNTVRIWNGHSGAELVCIRGHDDWVWAVAFAPDGTRLASGSSDGTVRLWDAEDGAELACLRGHENWVRGVAFAPDSRRVASASYDRTARVWDAESGAELACLRGHTDPVNGVAFAPDGKTLASASSDQTVRLWQVEGGAELACLRGHEDPVLSVAFAPDSKLVLSGSYDRTVRVWDARTGAQLACLRGHTDPVNGVAFSPDGVHVASAADDTTVRVWDVRTGKPVACLRGHEDWAWGVAFTADGRRLASGSSDRTVRIWAFDRGAGAARLRGHQDLVSTLAFSPDGSWLATGSADATVRLWDGATGAPLALLRGHTETVSGLAVSPDSRYVASASADKTVRLWDRASGSQLACLSGHEAPVWGVAFSPDGSRVASASSDRTVRLWDSETGSALACFRGHDDLVWTVAFSPDGTLLASGSVDATIRVWELAGRGMHHCLAGHEGWVRCVAFSPDGRRLASGSSDQTVRAWDVADGRQLACFAGHQGWVARVAFSPDGALLVSADGGETPSVRVWRVDEAALAFSPTPAGGPAWEALQQMEGGTDVGALAAGAIRHPWQGWVRGLETVIESAATRQAVARLPARLAEVVTHPGGLTWAGADRNHVYLFTLEGAAAAPPTRDSQERLLAEGEIVLAGPAPERRLVPLESAATASGAEPERQPWTSPLERARLSVTAPAVLFPGRPYALGVQVCLSAAAGEATPGRPRGSLPASGAALWSARLRLPGLQVEEPEVPLFWNGDSATAAFVVTAPEDTALGARQGTAALFAGGFQVARLRFALEVGSQEGPVVSLPLRERRHRAALASYAGQDRLEVLARLQGIRQDLPGLDILADVHSLRSGRYWLQRLLTEVMSRDVFYLFWSAGAARSLWVEKEWRTALQARGRDYVSLISLAPPGEAPPPAELRESL